MTTITPAYIIYQLTGGVEQEIHFDAIISEDHKTTAKITKFPVQEGFHVSNHSIRNNRPVSLTGVVSNVKIDLGEDDPKFDYGADPARYVKSIMDSLILSGQQCRVITNLGDYYPVIFTTFSTKQKAGMVDSMHFTITGEEIIISSTVSFAAPTPVTFTPVQEEERAEWVARLSASEVFVDSNSVLSKGSYKKGRDFVIYDEDAAGNPVETTYIFVGIDPSTGAEIYEAHVSENAVEVTGTGNNSELTPDACLEKDYDKSLLGGMDQVRDCVLKEASSVIVGAVTEVVDTAMGELTKSARGVFYDTVEFAGGPDSVGGALMTAGLSCVIRGATGNTDPGNYNPGESLPTTDQIMEGASQGHGFTEPPEETVTLIQIKCGSEGTIQTDVSPTLFPRF